MADARHIIASGIAQNWWSVCDHSTAEHDALAASTADEILRVLTESGFIIVAPNSIQLPRNRKEAEIMHLIAERFLQEPDTLHVPAEKDKP